MIDEVADDRFWFVQALMSETVAGALLGRERRRLHERCLLALDADPGRRDYAALVRHATSAGRYEQVAELARTGSRAALDAGQTFLALRLASQGLEEECGDVELLAVASEAAWRLDFLDEAAEHATTWVGAASGPSRVDALRLKSRVSFERQELELADAALDQLVEIAEGTTDPLVVRAAAKASLAQLCMFSHRSEEAVRWADMATVHARAAGDTVSAARAAVERASAQAWLVPREEARAELRAAIDMARAADDFVSTARGLGNLLVVVPAYTAEGGLVVDQLRELVRRAGFDKLGAVAAMQTCHAAIGLGDLADARRAVAQMWSTWMQPSTRDWVTQLEAFLAIEEGRATDADALLRSISARGTHRAKTVPVNDSPYEVLIMWLLLGSFRGDHRLGHEVFAELVRLSSAWTCSFQDLAVAVEAALAVGVSSRRVRDELVVRFADDRTMIDDARSYIEGLLAVADGRSRDAIALLEPLVGGEPDEELEAITRAALRVALARAHLADGKRERARELVDMVLDADLARWPGIRRDRAEELRHRIVPVRGDSASRAANAADSGRGGALTPREREVAGLISEGLTNGQLAERLFISPKTAAVHVSNILAKLDLSGRAEVAAWAVRNLGDLTAAVP